MLLGQTQDLVDIGGFSGAVDGGQRGCQQAAGVAEGQADASFSNIEGEGYQVLSLSHDLLVAPCKVDSTRSFDKTRTNGFGPALVLERPRALRALKRSFP